MVQCSDCGYLYALAANQMPAWEISEHLRTADAPETHGWEPLCAARAFDLRKEFVERQTEAARYAQFSASPRSIAWGQLLRFDRPCSEHVDWVPGFSPKEHREENEEHDLARCRNHAREDQHEADADREADAARNPAD